jgi:diguanylate cyclase (GGDEF)-like protein
MTKALVLLIAVIAVTEAMVMALLAVVGEAGLGTWLPALFDATAVSLVAILTINRMLKYSLISLQGSGAGVFIQLKVGFIVFVFEAIVMLMLHLLPFTLTSVQEGLVDVVILAFGASLVIYSIILKPASEEELDSLEKESRFDTTIATNLLAYVCVMILFFIALLSMYEQQLQQRSYELQQQETKELELAKAVFLNQLHQAARDLLIMSSQSDLKELVTGAKYSSHELQQDYRNISAIKSYYAQLRFLDINGQEMIRVQRDGEMIRVTPRDQLQNKSNRYYFQEGIRLNPGEIHISPLDLNVEHGVVQQPFNPVIRLTTPVADHYGNKVGLMVINLRGSYLLKELEHSTETTMGQVMLINEQGYRLFGRAPGAIWTSMFSEKSEYSFHHQYPEVWSKIQREDHSEVVTEDGVFIAETVEFSLDRVFTDLYSHEGHERHWPIWKLVSHIPGGLISEQMYGIRNLMLLVYVAALVLAAVGVIMLTQAMRKRQQAEQEVRQLAFYDALTGLTNRRLFGEKVSLEMAHARRHGTNLALMYLDLDYFKPINDELGHDAGDAVLREVAQRLKSCLREGDTVGRLGGDEFAVLLPRVGNNDDISGIAQRIVEAFAVTFHPLGHSRHLGVSIGIGILSEVDKSASDFTRRADHAMYEAKHSGRNCFHFATN